MIARRPPDVVLEDQRPASTLLKTMIDPNTPASVKVRAAEAIFNHAAKAIEIEDIDAGVSALEESIANEREAGRK